MAGRHRQARSTSVLRRVIGLGVTVVMVAGLILWVNVQPAAAATGTIVSMTFDDANADQFAAAQKLKSKGMAGTFYLNSGFINQPNYLTLAQVQSMKADGHEIASHTVSHADLAEISIDEAKRQICNDRVNWANWGMPVANFAYPFASSTTAVEQAAAACGDNSARGLGDIKTRFSCTNCPVGETVPPADKFYTKAPDQVESTWTLADLKRSVTQAETANNGSWVQLTFHHICTGSATTCPQPRISPTIYNQFVDWLATRASAGTVVRTVGSVIGGTTQPAVAGPIAPEAAPGVNAIKNPSMETFNAATGLPQCYLAGGYGSNTAAFATTTTAHTGTTATKLTVSNYANGDAKLVPMLDLGECAPTVTPGKTYTISEWYTSTAVTQFTVYYRTANGLWNYWTSSPWFGASSAWAQASWQTPAIPAEATALSFGLNLFNNGTLVTDDLSLTESGSTPTPPPAIGVQNPSMETANTATGLPQCYSAAGYGANSASFATTTAAHTGSAAVSLTMTGYTNGDAKLLPTLDAGTCAPAVTAGKAYTISEWYTSTAVTQFALYYRSADGNWNYWTSSPWFAASSAWAQASWQTPAVPAGATAISFGLSLFNNGTLVTDDLDLVEVGATPAALHTTSAFAEAVTGVDLTAAAARPDGSKKPKKKGATITEHNVVPSPVAPKVGRQGRTADRGFAPGAVVLQPFVVSPELTRG